MLQLRSNLGQSLPEFCGASRIVIHVPFHWRRRTVYHLKASSTLCFEHSVKMVVMARNLFSLFVSSIFPSSPSSSSSLMIITCVVSANWGSAVKVLPALMIASWSLRTMNFVQNLSMHFSRILPFEIGIGINLEIQSPVSPVSMLALECDHLVIQRDFT